VWGRRYSKDVFKQNTQEENDVSFVENRHTAWKGRQQKELTQAKNFPRIDVLQKAESVKQDKEVKKYHS